MRATAAATRARTRPETRTGLRAVALALAALAFVTTPAAPRAPGAEVLLDKVEALRTAFPDCDSALEIRRLLDPEEKAAIERRTRRTLEERGFLVYAGLRGGELDGLAVITNEIGKTEPITFLVATGLDGRVRRVAVMVYRESHGGEVRSRRFLSQLEGKRAEDPIDTSRDVVHVSGATLSSDALCRGTRKVLALLAELYLGRDGAAIVAGARRDGAREIALHDPARDGGVPRAPAGPVRVEARRLVMGSELSVVARSARPDALARIHAALDAAERLDAVLSDWRDDSELARVNRDAGGGPVPVSDSMLDFLLQSLELSRATRGAFDPTVGEIVRAYGFRGGEPRIPPAESLAGLLAGGGVRGLEVDAAARTVAFARPRLRLDPGAIGKGLALDAVADELLDAGIDDALLDFGSTQRALGAGEDGAGWRIAIRDPAGGARPLAEVRLADRSLSTSSGAEKFIEIDGRRLPHILDPRTGLPAAASASASVLASTAARADALSTALFVLGPGDGPAMIETLPDAAGLLLPAAERAQDAAPNAPIATSRWPRPASGTPEPGRVTGAQ